MSKEDACTNCYHKRSVHTLVMIQEVEGRIAKAESLILADRKALLQAEVAVEECGAMHVRHDVRTVVSSRRQSEARTVSELILAQP